MASDFNQERYYTSAGDIHGVLRAMINDRAGINIQFDDSNIASPSMVLSTNLPARTFRLDEFSTPEARKRAQNGASFTLNASINGIRVVAKELTVTHVGEDSDGSFYEVGFPQRLLYLQRRDAFRAWVPASLIVTVECKSPERAGNIHGRIQNMSSTGFRMICDNKVVPALEMMEVFLISARLPLVTPALECHATAIYAQYIQERNHTVLGFRFEDLDRQQQMGVNRFVNQLQRDAIT